MNFIQEVGLMKEVVSVFEELQADGTIAKIDALIKSDANTTVAQVSALIQAEAVTNPKLADILSKIKQLKLKV